MLVEKREDLASFNPLPSPKQGETLRDLLAAGPPELVSIRSPHRSKGRLNQVKKKRARALVSIRSPHRSKGRLDDSVSPAVPSRGFNPLPSPKQGETEAFALVHRDRLFQSAPLTEARGDKPPFPKLEQDNGFNPLPSPKQGETCDLHRVHPTTDRFQSAPLTEARGDLRPAPKKRVGPSFNPLPSPKQGETATGRFPAPSNRVSIRSPHRSKGRRPSLGDPDV